MNLFAENSTRRTGSRNPEGDDRPPRSEATLLGDASKVLASRPAALSRNNPESEPKPEARVPPAPSPALPSIGAPNAPDRCANVVASGAKWQGTLAVDDSVRIEGSFSGEIRAKGTVHISEGAQVDAKVRAQFVVISGTFKGDLRAEQRVDLLPHSRVSGELATKMLSVQEGAVLDSKVQMTGLSDAESKQQAAKASKPATPEGNNGSASASEPRPERETAETPVTAKSD